MTDLTVVNSRLAEAVGEYKVLCDTVECIEIKDDEGHKNAIELGSKINKFGKALEEKRNETLDPLREETKKINAIFKPVIDNVETLNKKLKDKIIPYQEAVEKRKKEWAEAQKQKELEEMEKRKNEMLAVAVEQENDLALDIAGNIEAEQKVIEQKEIKVKTIVKSAGAKSSLRRDWTFEITDEKIVPRTFLCVDEKAIKQLIKDKKEEIENGTLTLAGIRFYQTTDLRY